ncbi:MULTISPECIES: 4-(cytidine 5'-diphospho)-2-C-methyl-D-erythritol kinase [unclassified Polaromonas]|uniref:4-(cytidine 5'-diphospho)-2-C-methyl-D-erythritol kinase n=1 Tax=unclassified Polaromonas TaxID=2638319 RepID=UPI000BD46D7B|nr:MULTISPECIES: 4-(cytidine 5'-diphospho)-2-C-methyl-D-erythritol kinase [unclassified Polaromonas]OYY34833.1 MAG: 4-(cytidine 5'-diphospho)-2-C-methyl-D-erythritol kinase [Polaromonas sp. 35-63-35]OYZ19515.1 MAG: 4-(cytidine 5'-diphospho)-2-C-methyl-D-erythritol kinase [Polaromonas sp. 16-63-31]OYZ77586.1 MAG: 4-(cytidine 5'-diphospho)-2-C-methyl-D-erythritol kinase [Polaromonas sp. 24-63-21]OZA48559.1 MAG: 4-(cytidine 5'-diphospho)-2-C-methyl-D-erythritol kinase [Polaromonas sp. 17-63-33]OZ
MKAIYDVAAPAKLNLFLHITGRRPDGYHLLQSVFMLIDWCDTLHFELRQDGQITRTDLGSEASEALPAEDLVVRAARALQSATGTPLGVHIGLEKRIPSQAGMGGGSSDAASCLLSLQRLWGVRLPTEQLQAIALGLGADVPFFLSGGHAWVEGVGEKITPLALPAARFVVVKPAAGLPTDAIFRSPGLKRDTETATIRGFAANANGSVYEFGHNDLQPVAQTLCPQVGQSLDWLSMQHLQGRMTGSGSAVFAHMPHEMELAVAPGDWQVRKCSNLDAHPLAGW